MSRQCRSVRDNISWSTRSLDDDCITISPPSTGTMQGLLHLSSSSCLRISPITCPTLCKAFMSSSVLSKSVDKVRIFSRTIGSVSPALIVLHQGGGHTSLEVLSHPCVLLDFLGYQQHSGLGPDRLTARYCLIASYFASSILSGLTISAVGPAAGAGADVDADADAEAEDAILL